MALVIRPHDPRAVDRTTLATISIDGQEFPNLESFSYSSDVLQIGDPFAVSIPDPTGQYAVGTRSLALVDRSRREPFTSEKAPRSLVLQLWYPTADTEKPRALYMPRSVAQYLASSGLPQNPQRRNFAGFSSPQLGQSCICRVYGDVPQMRKPRATPG